MVKQTIDTSAVDALDTYVSNRWWMWLTQGVLAILFGLAALFWPGLTIVTLVYLFGIYLLVTGVVAVILALTGVGKRGSWILSLLIGLVQLGVGVYLLRHPGVSFEVLIALIGFSLIFFGVLSAVATFLEKGVTVTERTLSVIAGLLALVAGVVVLAQPAASGVAFVWILGLFSLIYGPITIAQALDAKQAVDELKTL